MSRDQIYFLDSNSDSDSVCDAVVSQTYLFNTWLVGIEQRPRFDVFGHQMAADLGYLLPMMQYCQRQVLVVHLQLISTCTRYINAYINPLQLKFFFSIATLTNAPK